ncbi:hypothetical protein HMPREF1392_01034 [Helicobacter pylori GAM101Biv]|uniref:Uncharacterized protein n=1 Tax=Helicobacter pylori GAM100Ai TaxID=1159019 RepID=A0AB72ZV82_HELPX|nr:hypothetical protein HMPREF1391_00801 [Helicobacter pylori GAM100Ai]EMG82427.1 hypothetical protein HMPREF1392_01034 [Helicobacter pylori GAM101Biv]
MRGRCCKHYLNSFSFELKNFLSGFILPFYPFSYLFSFLVCYKIIF